ncbi:olfactory receptor 10G7-like [Pelodytes ibericus]
MLPDTFKPQEIPALKEHLLELHSTLVQVQDSLRCSIKNYKIQDDHRCLQAPMYQVRERVWLSTALCSLVTRYGTRYVGQSKRYFEDKMNYSSVNEFILLGLPHTDVMKIPLFVLFFSVYLLTLLGNMIIILAVRGDPHLHKPMYLFLLNLSFLDILFSTVTLPKMLTNFIKEKNTISFKGCIAQFYFFHFFGSTECFLYAVMAYDRFLAICRPLHYSSSMSLKTCVHFTIGIWVTGSVHSMIHTTLTFRLPFCGPNKIDSFFCDVIPMLKLACADTTVNKALIITNIGAVALICFVMILISYAHIVIAILNITSSEGRRKTFSTCASHMISVTLFYGPPVFIYLRPNSEEYLVEETIAVFYTLMTPMLNPIIYSLRNMDVHKALRKIRWSIIGEIGQCS